MSAVQLFFKCPIVIFLSAVAIRRFRFYNMMNWGLSNISWKVDLLFQNFNENELFFKDLFSFFPIKKHLVKVLSHQESKSGWYSPSALKNGFISFINVLYVTYDIVSYVLQACNVSRFFCNFVKCLYVTRRSILVKLLILLDELEIRSLA